MSSGYNRKFWNVTERAVITDRDLIVMCFGMKVFGIDRTSGYNRS